MEWNMTGVAASYYKATLAVTTGLSAPFSNLAMIYKQQGNHADVISCYKEALRIDPLAVDGLVNRGNTYKEIGRANEVIQDYIRGITVRPTMPEAHANLASAYKDSSEKKEVWSGTKLHEAPRERQNRTSIEGFGPFGFDSPL